MGMSINGCYFVFVAQRLVPSIESLTDSEADIAARRERRKAGVGGNPPPVLP